MTDVRILMVGLSDSGKTTFLASLYELVRADNPVDEALQLVEEPEHRDYFHEIAQTWLRLERMTHSNADAPRHTSLLLKTPDNEQFHLEIPDISGEDFNHAWEGDPWPEEVKQIASSATGVLIFARRDQIVKPLLLPPDDTPPPGKKQEWSAKDAPTQTKLADLLETLDSLVPHSLPMALIGSAWDVDSDEPEVRPDQWLKLRLPLLWQMLESRRDTRPYAVFGVSAQGGDVEDPAERERLAQIRPAYMRARVCHGEVDSVDISSPIRWLFDQIA